MVYEYLAKLSFFLSFSHPLTFRWVQMFVEMNFWNFSPFFSLSIFRLELKKIHFRKSFEKFFTSLFHNYFRGFETLTIGTRLRIYFSIYFLNVHCCDISNRISFTLFSYTRNFVRAIPFRGKGREERGGGGEEGV